MRTSSRTPMRDLLELARRYAHSFHPNRHTAAMRYPVEKVINRLFYLIYKVDKNWDKLVMSSHSFISYSSDLNTLLDFRPCATISSID